MNLHFAQQVLLESMVYAEPRQVDPVPVIVAVLDTGIQLNHEDCGDSASSPYYPPYSNLQNLRTVHDHSLQLAEGLIDALNLF